MQPTADQEIEVPFDAALSERELGLVYTPVAETFRRTAAWAMAEGLVTRPLPAMATSR